MSDPKTTNTAPESAETAAAEVTKSASEPKKKSRKKLIIIIAVIAAVVVIAGVILIVALSGKQSDANTEEDVEYINVQTGAYYSGVIEPQQTSEINKDPERTVKEVYVKVGDTVKKGDKLFEYDTNETATKLSKAKIEYDSIQNDITENNNQISQYQRARSRADESEQMEYTQKIQEAQNTKSQHELDLRIKQVEIENLQQSLDNSVITSPIDGIIKQINNSSEAASTGAFMTVLMNGSYRVKGQVDESTVRNLEAGMDVVIHSRVLKDKTWNGTITKVDTGNPADKNNNGGGADNGNSDNAATKYYFYATLESSADLLLGEHVYVEVVYEKDAELTPPAGGSDEQAGETAPADDAQN